MSRTALNGRIVYDLLANALQQLIEIVTRFFGRDPAKNGHNDSRVVLSTTLFLKVLELT